MPETTPENSTVPVPESKDPVSVPTDVSDAIVESPDEKPTEPVASSNVDIEIEFSSKETPRINGIMADGIAFLRESSGKIIEKITVGDTPIVVVALELAQWAESYMKVFTGQERKRVVIKLLLWLIDNQEDVLKGAMGDDTDKLRDLVSEFVPSILDAVCDAAKGKLSINTVVEVGKKCCVFWGSH